MKVFDNLEEYSSNLAVNTEDGIRLSYNDFLIDADCIGKKLNKRSLIFIITGNNSKCVTGYVGALRANAVVALINDSIRKSFFNDLILKFKPSYIYQPQKMFPFENNWKVRFKIEEYVLYETNIEIDYNINDDLSLILMTSGSTGIPEFVRLSHNNIFSNTKAICEYLKISSNDVAITTLPMSYSYGISIINTHLFMGASIILTDRSLMEKKFWEMISNHKATTFGGVPYTFEMLKKLKFEKISIPSIKYITQAGGKLSKDLLDYFSSACVKKKIDFIVMYGQTEASPRMSYLPPNILQKKLGSIGIPIPEGKFYLIDEKHQIIDEPNVEGELVYEGENVCLGYARNCYDLAKGDFNKGVLETGDIAKMDTDSYYFITGRKKRFLKLFGNRINLDQVEQKINEAGYNCACVGTDDQMEVYTTEKSNIKNIYKYISEYFDLNKSAFSIICIDKIPRNNSGKILYPELEKN